MGEELIAVAGGTGTVGKFVVEELERQGKHTRVLARSRGVDLITGRGLDDALNGTTTIIDVSNLNTTNAKTSIGFFSTVAQNLVTAGRKAGVQHLIALSIVGSDRIDFGYYMGKREQELIVSGSRLPWTVLRATQFFEFPQILARTRSPIVFAPRMRSQPIAAREVADQLVQLALTGPTWTTLEMSGPETIEIPDLTRRWIRHTGSSRPVMSFPVPGSAGRAMAGGELIPAEPAVRGTETFTHWLSTRT